MDKKEVLILQSAIHVFEKFGYSKAALEDIAAEAGISRSSIYLYFKNKRELYRRVLEYVSTGLTDGLGEQLGNLPKGIDVRLHKILSWLYAHKTGENGHIKLFLSPGKAEDIAGSIMAKMDDAIIEIFEKELNEMVIDGIVKLPDPLTSGKVAEVLFSTASGLAENSPSQPEYLLHLETFMVLIKRALQAG
ncbi:MAG: TetR/AcrR family transcriptional regulator [Bacteroidota bacterium]